MSTRAEHEADEQGFCPAFKSCGCIWPDGHPYVVCAKHAPNGLSKRDREVHGLITRAEYDALEDGRAA